MQQANEAYNKARKEVQDLLEQLQTALIKKDAAQEKNPTNWGYVGDVKYIKSQLENLLGNA